MTHSPAPRRAVVPWPLIGLVALACLLLVTPVWAEDEGISLEQVFERTKECRGIEYAVGRDLLASQGERILPFLVAHADDEDWRARMLAAALEIRIRTPDRATEVSRALAHAFSWPTLQDPHTDRVNVMWRRHTPTGLGPPQHTILTRADVGLLAEVLREGGSSATSRINGVAAVRVLGLLREARAAPALIETYDGYTGDDFEVVHEVLVAIGEPAVGPLSKRLRHAATDEPRSYEERIAMRASAPVAEVLGRIGGPEAEAVLLECLPDMHRKVQVLAVSRALASLRVERAVSLVFEKMRESLAVHRLPDPQNRGDHLAGYAEMRPILLAFGDSLARFLREHSGAGHTLAERALGAGLLFEHDTPEEADAFYRAHARAHGLEERWRRLFGGWWRTDETYDAVAEGRSHFWERWGWRRGGPRRVPPPIPLLLEGGFAFSDVEDLERLARLTEPDLAYEVVAEALLHPLRFKGAGPVAFALAERGEARVLDLFDKLLEPAPPPRLPYPVPYVGELVEALLFLDDPGSVPLLQKILDHAAGPPSNRNAWYREAVDLAEAALAFFAASDKERAALLESEHAAVRLSAARVLARLGDPRGLDTLLDAMLAADSEGYEPVRTDVLRLGGAALVGIAVRRGAATDPRTTALLDALSARIERVDGGTRIDRAVAHGLPPSSRHRAPQLTDYAAAGKRLAKHLGAKARPVLEEIALLGARHGESRLATFALASIGDERSIPVIVAVARRDPAAAAMALEAFGEKGIEAARRIPKPDPERPAFAGRGRRHIAAADALTRTEDPRAVEKILEGLNEPEPLDYGVMRERRYRPRMVEYLRLAFEHHDERFVEPVIRLIRDCRWPEVREEAFRVIGFYEDERIVDLCLPHIPQTYARDDTALRALVRQLGSQCGPFLLEHFESAADEDTKLRMARALARLEEHGAYHYGRNVEEDDVATRREAVKGSGALAIRALRSLMEEASPETQAKAAAELASMNYLAKEPEPIEILVGWLAGHPSPPHGVLCHLEETKPEGVGDALLASYRIGNLEWVGTARVLGVLEHEPALPFVLEALERRLAGNPEKPSDLPEMETAVRLGTGGREKVLDLLRSDLPSPIRVRAACLLGSAGHDPAYEPIRDLFLSFVERGYPPNDGTSRARDARSRHHSALRTAAGALARLRPETAYTLLVRVLMRTEDPALRKVLVSGLLEIRHRHPDLRPEPTRLR